MNRIQLTKNLYLDEYIPMDLYTQYLKRPSVLMSLLDARLVKADQMLRDHFGSVTINNWFVEGPRNWSGLRLPGSPDYSLTSQHSFGRASDKIFKYPAQEIREYIQANWEALGITRMEGGVSWVHTDVAYTGLSELVIFSA